MAAKVTIKRVYEPAAPGDGTRVLVDRLWPRGLKKEAAHIDLWLKEAAPSPGLRQWFAHRPERWEDFCRRYWAELDRNPEAVQALEKLAAKGRITLLYAARDATRNNAEALRRYLTGAGRPAVSP